MKVGPCIIAPAGEALDPLRDLGGAQHGREREVAAGQRLADADDVRPSSQSVLRRARCRCARSRWRSRRGSPGRRAPGPAGSGGRRSAAGHGRMPPAPCSSGSTMTAAISSACCSKSVRATRSAQATHLGVVPSRSSRPGAAARRRARGRAGVHAVHAAVGVAHAHRRERVAVVAAADREEPGAAACRPGPATPSSSRPRPRPTRSRRGRRAGARTSSTSRRPSSTAGSWVRPPNMTWLIRPSWSRTAASSSGTAYPWIAHHHDDIASTTSTVSEPSRRSRSRTPLADSTSCTGDGEVAEEYGCHRWSRSQASRSRAGGQPLRHRPVLDAGRGPRRAGSPARPSGGGSARSTGAAPAAAALAHLVTALGEVAAAVPAVPSAIGHGLRSAHSAP